MEIALGVLSLAVLGLIVPVWLLGRRVLSLSASVSGAEAQARAAAGEAQRLRESLAEERAGREQSGRRVVELSESLAEARARLADATDRLGERDAVEARFREAFEALSAKALREGRQEFIAQARPVFESAKKEQADLVRPIGEVLAATREKLESIEKSRAESFASLHQRIELVARAGEGLREETGRLTKALSRPEIRGRYGEIQLRRVAELAGMTAYCDFSEQASVRDGENNLLRPDMIVRLPNERVIAVDAKTNIDAYVEAVNAGDEAAREGHLHRFAAHVAEQARKLAAKGYWTQFDGAHKFVVMFVPGDQFIDAALSRRPELLEEAAQRGVILASPSTLIGLLRAVAVGWDEHRVTENYNALMELGRELHERASVVFEHAEKLGGSIRQSVERFNGLVGSMQSRLLPTMRKFEASGIESGRPVVEPTPLEAQPKQIQLGAP
jgi:DNA recombination protein RmuC